VGWEREGERGLPLLLQGAVNDGAEVRPPIQAQEREEGLYLTPDPSDKVL
jgi:hypothetical protein